MAVLKFLRDEEAATTVEYAVMLAVILMTVIGVVGSVGNESGAMWGGITTVLQAAGL